MRKLNIMIIFAFTIFLSACGSQFESNMSTELPDFEFTDQNGDSFSNTDLDGEWWVADLIFTNCITVCDPMTNNMVELQQEINEKNLDVQFLSFTVDPDHDTPEVLMDYANSYDVDLKNWTFLTGYDFETIQDISADSFYTKVEMNPDSDQVQHGVRFYLINPDGEVVKNYSGIEKENMRDIIEDLESVL